MDGDGGRVRRVGDPVRAVGKTGGDGSRGQMTGSGTGIVVQGSCSGPVSGVAGSKLEGVGLGKGRKPPGDSSSGALPFFPMRATSRWVFNPAKERTQRSVRAVRKTRHASIPLGSVTGPETRLSNRAEDRAAGRARGSTITKID